MQFCYTEEEQQVVAAVSAFARKELLPLQREMEEKGAMPDAVRARFADLSVLRLPFPEEAGGADGTFSSMILAVRELGYASPVPPNLVLENFVLAWPVFRFGSATMKEKVLPGLLSLDLVGGLAFTEPDTGSDPRQLKTAARKVDGGWILNGVKRFITYSGICDHLVLFAKTAENQVGAFLVSRNQPGYQAGRREHFLHMAVDNGDVILTDYFAPDDCLIGTVEQGFDVLLNAETLGKIGFCSIFLGAARRAMDLALSYALTKMHRDKPIGIKFQMIQEKLARMAVELEAANAYLEKLCAKVDRGGDPFFDAAALKIMTAKALRTIADCAMEIHGAYSLSSEYEVGRIYAMAAAVPVVMGSLDIQKVIVSRTLLAAGRYAA
ncbi:MAG: acyl-CoA dehydrogenase family protein [Thermodesulfobacteriota bacterium]